MSVVPICYTDTERRPIKGTSLDLEHERKWAKMVDATDATTCFQESASFRQKFQRLIGKLYILNKMFAIKFIQDNSHLPF